MKSSDLTNPGPSWQGLRHDIARAVSEANVNKREYASSLKDMLQEASDAIDADETPEE